MRILIQRVRRASVTIGGELHSAIGMGLLVFVGIEEADDEQDIGWLTGKLTKLRIFADDAGVMNRSAEEVQAEIMVVSQFTLHAMTKKGNLPWYEYVYDEYYDCVLCPQNQILSYSTTNRDGNREYKSKSYICKNCPVRERCTENQQWTDRRRIGSGAFHSSFISRSAVSLISRIRCVLWSNVV